MSIDQTDVIVNEYNNEYPRAIIMKPVNVNFCSFSSPHFNFGCENDEEYPKFEGGDHVKTLQIGLTKILWLKTSKILLLFLISIKL